MIFTIFERVVIIKSIKFQLAQTAYQIHNIDHINILIDLVFEITFEKGERSDIEKPILLFSSGVLKITSPLPVLKGLKDFFRNLVLKFEKELSH